MQGLGPKVISYDISLGVEKIPVTVTCKDGSNRLPKPFKYIRENSFHKSVLEMKQSNGKDILCACRGRSGCGKSSSCNCAFSAGGLPPYTKAGLLHPHYIEMVRNPFKTLWCSNLFLHGLIRISQCANSRLLIYSIVSAL